MADGRVRGGGETAQVRSMRGEMEEWEKKVKAAEEVRWRAGMNLAKAKAEMDWRLKADQVALSKRACRSQLWRVTVRWGLGLRFFRELEVVGQWASGMLCFVGFERMVRWYGSVT